MSLGLRIKKKSIALWFIQVTLYEDRNNDARKANFQNRSRMHEFAQY